MELRRPGTAVGFVVVLSNAALSLGLGGCGKPAAPVAAPGPAVESAGKPLTDEECRAAGEAIGEAARSGDQAALDRMIDWDAVIRRSTDGIEAPESFRKNFSMGLKNSQLDGKGLARNIVDTVQKGGSFSLLRRHAEGKNPRLLFRLLFPQAGVNYLDFVLVRRPDGKVKAVDVYVYLSGEMLSETFRRGYIQAVAQGEAGFVDRLLGADQQYVKNLDKIRELLDATRGGRFGEAMNLYKAFPPGLKKEKTVLLLHLQAAQTPGFEAEYARAIEAFRANYPSDACVDILSIDYFLLKKQYRECLDCIDRLDQAARGDAYLGTLRANVHLEQGDLAAARAALKKAGEQEPGLIDVYWGLVNVALKEKNYDETLASLRLIREKFEVEFSDFATLPTYKGFTESPQYQEWLEENPKPAPDAEAKGPAGKSDK